MISGRHQTLISSACRTLMPYLAVAGAVVEADRVIDIQILAWPVLASLAICAVASSNRQ